MELMQRLLYTLIGAASFFYAYVKLSLSHWKKRGILHEKPNFFWGNLKGVGSKKQLQLVLSELYEKYKSTAPFIGFYAFLKPMLLILDLDLVQQILNSDAAYFMERGLYHNVKDAPLTYNLLQLDADKWHELQPKLKPCYAADKMQLLLPTLERVARTFTHSLQQLHLKQDIFNINELMDSYNLDVISLVAFGFQSDTLRSSTATEFQQMSKRHWLNCSYLKAYLAMEFPNIARLFQYKLYDQAVSDYFMKIVQDKLKERERNRNSYTSCDFLKIFSATKQQLKLDQRLTSAQMAAHGFSFILIGLEACTSTMAMCLYELAAHPELQQKARSEINRVLAANNDEVNVECLKELHYLKQVLYETLRKYPPYPVLLRKVTQDYEVPNSTFMLRRDNHLIIPVAAIHNDPNLYPEPQKFDPERFEPAAKAERHLISWLPFGSGARGCLAQEFAVKQMLMGLLTLLRDYEFSPCAETVMPPKYDNKWVFQLKTSHDIKLKLKCLR